MNDPISPKSSQEHTIQKIGIFLAEALVTAQMCDLSTEEGLNKFAEKALWMAGDTARSRENRLFWESLCAGIDTTSSDLIASMSNKKN